MINYKALKKTVIPILQKEYKTSFSTRVVFVTENLFKATGVDFITNIPLEKMCMVVPVFGDDEYYMMKFFEQMKKLIFLQSQSEIIDGVIWSTVLKRNKKDYLCIFIETIVKTEVFCYEITEKEGKVSLKIATQLAETNKIKNRYKKILTDTTYNQKDYKNIWIKGSKVNNFPTDFFSVSPF